MRGFLADTMNATVENLQKQCGAKPFNMFAREFTTDEEILLNELKSATVFLMPSKVEGFGLTGLDAISAGVPLIASAASGLGWLLARHANHFSGDLKRIASQAILDADPDGDAVLSEWRDRLTAILTNPGKAFTEADDLRKALAPKVSWSLAAQTVTAAARHVLKAAGGSPSVC
jgi:glycosyltransferase involved in cell wall biosynthesis